jgi:carbon storage regulator
MSRRRFFMLVLSRKSDQKIHIGPDITVTILEVSGKFVRVGIEAPDSVSILRGEVKEQIESENRMAASRTKHLDELKKIGGFRGLFSLKPRRKDDSGGE